MSKPRKKGGGKGRPPAKKAAPKAAAKATAAKATAASAGAGAAPASAPSRKPSREERWEEARRAKRRKALVQRAIAVGVIVAILGAVVAWQVNKRRSESRAISAMESGTCEFDRKTDPGAVNEHADTVAFKVEPPSGGVHTPSAAQPGIYIDRPAPPDGQLVHALEHGDIAIWYRPDLPEQDVTALRDLAGRYETDVLIVPRPQLPVQVAATAWRKRLLCDRLEVKAFERFIERWHDKGPEGQVD